MLQSPECIQAFAEVYLQFEFFFIIKKMFSYGFRIRDRWRTKSNWIGWSHSSGASVSHFWGMPDINLTINIVMFIYWMLWNVTVCITIVFKFSKWIFSGVSLGVRFPRKQLTRRLFRFRYKLTHLFRLYIGKNRFGRKFTDDVAEYCNNVAECFNFLCDYYLVSIKFVFLFQ